MKQYTKYVRKSLAVSMPVSAFLFIISGIITDLNRGGSLSFEQYGFTKMALASLIIGLGFGLPTALYANDKLSPLLASVLHFGTGTVVMVAAGIFAGWIPTEKGLLPALIMVAAEIAVAALIWFFSWRHYQKLARQMNERLKTREN